MLVARRQQRLEELASGLLKEYSIECRILPVDLTSDDAADAVAGFLDSEGLDLDLLVNNAGFGRVGLFHEEDPQRIDDMIQLNAAVLAKLTRLVLPGMVARGRGGILNVASSAAFQPAPVMGLYHATKSFVLFLTEAIAEEVRGSGVNVTALCPGPVAQTEFGDHLGTETKVAGIGLVRIPAARVAKAGIDGVEKGKTIVVPGAWMWLSSLVSPRLPRWMTRKITHRIQLTRARSLS